MQRLFILLAALIIIFSTKTAAQQFPGMEPDVEGHGFSATYSLLNATGYNRVEGAFLGGEFTIKNEHVRGLELTTMIGHGLKSKKWRKSVRLEHALDFFRYKTFYLSAFDITGSNDMDIVGNVENSLSSLLFHRDYRDYYRLQGFETGMDLRYKQKYGVTFSLKYAEFGSMTNATEKSVFYSSRHFRTNPAVHEGDAIIARAGVYYSNRENIYVDANYWEFDFEMEHDFGDYDFDGFHASLKRIQLGFGNQTLIAYGAASLRPNANAEQFLFDLGGTSTLRGYGFKEFSGNQRILFSAEYQFNGDILQKIPLQKIPFYSSTAMSLFFDAGRAWMSDTNSIEPIEMPDGLGMARDTVHASSNFRSSVGCSLYLLNKMFRLDLAKRLDTSRDPWKFNLRFIWGLKS